MEALQNFLFIDIETASVEHHLSDLSENLQTLWRDKSTKKGYAGPEENDFELIFKERAAVFAEFGRVVCIGIRCFIKKEDEWVFAVKNISGEDEALLLNKFCSALETFSKRIPKFSFCGHNIKEFDLPYLSRRMIINGIKLPESLRLQGKKPWEVTHVDTMEQWSFGDRKNYTSLALLAEVLGIPTPKDDISGAEVGRVFWEEKNLVRIGTYCEKDVITTALVFRRLAGYEESPFNIEHLS